MPTYEYACLQCGHNFEAFLKVSEKDKPISDGCPKCKSEQVQHNLFAPATLYTNSQGLKATDQ